MLPKLLGGAKSLSKTECNDEGDIKKTFPEALEANRQIEVHKNVDNAKQEKAM